MGIKAAIDADNATDLDFYSGIGNIVNLLTGPQSLHLNNGLNSDAMNMILYGI